VLVYAKPRISPIAIAPAVRAYRRDVNPSTTPQVTEGQTSRPRVRRRDRQTSRPSREGPGVSVREGPGARGAVVWRATEWRNILAQGGSLGMTKHPHHRQAP